MLRRICTLLALLASAADPVWAQAKGPDEGRSLQELKNEFRRLTKRTSQFQRNDDEALDVLEEILEIPGPAAEQFLLVVARDPRHAKMRATVLQMLTHARPESPLVAGYCREHMKPKDPDRKLARAFLIQRAIRLGDDTWLVTLAASGTHEDRFLALRGMGRVGSRSTLDTAWELMQDTTWKPKARTVVRCGTIAASLRRMESARAARLLLLLARDPRFAEEDAHDLRDATRLWGRRDLRLYIDLAELASPDPKTRVEIAHFLGKAGFEAARAPLLHLAGNEREPVEVRVAATTALGGLRIARGALTLRLSELLKASDVRVRRAAIAGLGLLAVRQAAETLVAQLGGELDAEARAALAQLVGLPAEKTDWRAWLAGPECRLPKGT